MDTTGNSNDCLENGIGEAMPVVENKKEKIFITTKIKKHKNWTKEEDVLLIEVANKFRQKSWTKVALFFKDKNPAQCRARYKRIRPGIVKGAWTKDEDKLITDLVNKTGKNWALISKMMPTRNGKQIRDRFLNYLDPNINKIKFTDEDDKKIIENYIKHGSKWSVIAKYFEGRTGDMIKNRFYSCLKRKVHVYEVNTSKRIRKKYYKSKRSGNSITQSLPCNIKQNQTSNHLISKDRQFLDNKEKGQLNSIFIIKNNNEVENSRNEQINKMSSPLDHIMSGTDANSMLVDNYISNLSKQKYDPYALSEMLAKNLENINKMNFLNISNILNLKTQLANESEINKINFLNGLNLQPFFTSNISQNDLLMMLNLNLHSNAKHS